MPDTTEQPFRYDVALSFAGSDRAYVEAVAEALKEDGLEVFYDRDQRAALWGEDLIELLDEVYQKQSRYVVIFISQAYAEREWTRHERRSAMARALLERSAYVLPARFDDTELPGLRPTVGYLDLRGVDPSEVSNLIRQKLQVATPLPSEDGELNEFTMFASELEAGLARLQPKIADFRVGYSEPSGVHLTTPADVLEFVHQRFAAGLSITRNLDRILTPEIQLRAFGPPGRPGDKATIRHMAANLTRMAESMLDWAATIREALAPEDAQSLLWALSRYAEPVIDEHVAFVERFRQSIEEALARPEPSDGSIAHIQIGYTLDLSPTITRPFDKELKRYKKAHRLR